MAKQEQIAPRPLSKAEMTIVLDKMVNDFESAFGQEQGARLVKATPGQEVPAEKNPENSSSAPGGDENASAPPPAEGSESTGASPADASAGGPPAGADPAAAGGDPAAGADQGQPPTPEQIKAEFDQMPVEEVKIYLLGAKASLMERMGGAGAPDGASPEASASAGGPPAGAPPAAGPPAAAGSPGSPPPEMGKGEFDDKSGKVKAGSMSKAEVEFGERLSKAEAAIAENASLRKALSDKDAEIAAKDAEMAGAVQKLAAGFQKILSGNAGPMRKSVAGISDLRVTGKAGEPVTAAPLAKADVSGMTRAEAVRKLNALTSDSEKLGKLAKSDRDRINGFVAGNLKIEDVAAYLG